MTPLVSAVAAPLLLAAAVLVWPVRTARSVARLGALWPGYQETAVPARRRQLPARTLAATGAGLGVAAFVGLPWGVPFGLAAALLARYLLGRLEPPAVAKRRARLAADLPVAADLLAACHSAGSTPAAATAAVGEAVGGPLGAALHRVVALLRLGADPVDAWSVLADEPVLAPLARAVSRAVSSGAPVADAMAQLADVARQERRAAAEETARKVGVRATLPLGLCFLPAFVLLGVVPVAAGIAVGLDVF